MSQHFLRMHRKCFFGLLVGLASCAPIPEPKIQDWMNLEEVSLVLPASGDEAPMIFIEQEQSIPYHSAPDTKRLVLLQKALHNPSTSIIWGYRGGYGSARLIEGLEKTKPPKNPKLFVGYSDLTALHLFFSQRWNWKTLHAPVAKEFIHKRSNFDLLKDVLEKKEKRLILDDLVPLNKHAKGTHGLLTGGNLTILSTSVGTSWQIQANDKIIFIEDVGEKGYQVDRYLLHLRQAGVFDHARAVIFGDFANPSDTHVTYALERFASEVPIPVFKSSQFGHGTINRPLLYHGLATITMKDQGHFMMEQHIQ